MILLAVFSWWYRQGWSGQIHRASGRIARTMEFFSVSLLARTLFDPFRQIDADVSGGRTMNAQMHAAFDRTFSRIMGFVVRSFSIGFGLVSVFFVGMFGVLQVVLWPVVPLLPLVGAVMLLLGVGGA